MRHRLLLAALAMLVVAAPAAGAAPVTNAGDQARTGWYPDEPSLSPQLVAGGTFGQQWNASVTGQVYAQPLFSNGVLLVATEANMVYGLDPNTGAQKWTPRNLGTPFNPLELDCWDLTPNVGVTATPVIDPATGIAYLTSKTYIAGTPAWLMHAIDVTTGAEQPGFPVRIEGSAQNNPATTFNAKYELQRPGLLLLDGVVYAGFGGHCDRAPYQGWVAGVSTSGHLKALWVDRGGANETGAGIWQSGGGLVSDGPGQIILTTGNGGSPAPGTPGSSPPADLAESVVRLHVKSDGTLEATDFFAPYDSALLDDWDADVSSGSPVALPPSFGTASFPHLLLQTGKQGYLYLLDRDDLGGSGTGPQGSDRVVSRIGPDGGVWSRPSVWPGDGGYVWVPTAGANGWGTSGVMHVYRSGVDGGGRPTLALAATSGDGFGFSSGAPVITSDGTSSGSGVVWTIWSPNASGEGGQLRAYNATPTGGSPLLLGSWPIGTASKFAPPGVSASRIYVGTRDGRVIAFGSPVTPPLDGASVQFGTVRLGDSVTRNATFTATRPLTVTGVSAGTGAFTAGEPSKPLGTALATGDTISVPVTFAPTDPGFGAGTLDVDTSAGHLGIALSGRGQSATPLLYTTPPAVSFGGTPVGGNLTGTATFSNEGAQPLTIDAVHLPSAPFSATGVPGVGAQIAPGAAITVSVSFEPTAIGNFDDALALETTGGDREVGLSGAATTVPHLVITPPQLDLGTVSVGDEATGTFTLENTGGSPLTITKSKPPAAGAFTALTALDEGTTIRPGGSLTQTVRFKPTVPGTAGDAWAITATDDTGPHSVTMTAAGVDRLAGQPPLFAPPAPPGDRPAAVRLLALRVSPKAFRPRRRGTVVHWELNRQARVAFRLTRLSPRGRLVAVAGGSWNRVGHSGANSSRFSGRLHGRSLPPGRYRLAATPAGGGSTRHAALRVMR